MANLYQVPQPDEDGIYHITLERTGEEEEVGHFFVGSAATRNEAFEVIEGSALELGLHLSLSLYATDECSANEYDITVDE